MNHCENNDSLNEGVLYGKYLIANLRLLHIVFTSITGVQSHIDSLSHTITIDSNSFNITTIDTSWFCTTVTTKFKSLIYTSFKDRRKNMNIREWQSISIREVPVSTMGTLSSSTTCVQVSVTLNTVTTTDIVPHLTDVHIGMVSQILAHE